VNADAAQGAGVGVVRAQVIRANGDVEDLGVISKTSIPIWRRRERRWLRDNIKKGC
jgi:hypothetical protein